MDDSVFPGGFTLEDFEHYAWLWGVSLEDVQRYFVLAAASGVALLLGRELYRHLKPWLVQYVAARCIPLALGALAISYPKLGGLAYDGLPAAVVTGAGVGLLNMYLAAVEDSSFVRKPGEPPLKWLV